MSSGDLKDLDLSDLPPVFVFTTHLSDDLARSFEDRLFDYHANLTFDINEASIILTKVGRKRRAQFDLQAKGLCTEALPCPPQDTKSSTDLRQTKRPRLLHSSSPTESADDAPGLAEWSAPPPDTVTVLKLDWLDASFTAGHAVDSAPFLIFCGRKTKTDHPLPNQTSDTTIKTSLAGRQATGQSNLERRTSKSPHKVTPSGRSFGHGGHPPHLLLQTTSEHDLGSSSDLPDMPDWVEQGVKYACQRISLAESKNKDFIELLKDIKLARLLTNDEIGVRAYSTSIAALYAYPHKLSSPREVLAIPGCDLKIANLFVEFANTGQLKAAQDARDDPELKVLRLFYEIWGVGSLTAREFYYDRGWRDLDDIVEFGWSTLQRVQQIGVKFYDEFLLPIPRDEVELIASIIHRHAVKVRDQGIQSLLVGGHRRGKSECGDVDIIVSHPDEAQTLNIINDIVASLETEGWITHTLLLSLTTSNRDQKTLPYRAGGSGGGFDSLDKALVVWQDPEWPTKSADLVKNPKAKNPNIHRRVDIIIAPWSTVGCAVAGWSGGTTFQRDLRRYVKATRGWKFDSSGIRDRASGKVIDVEDYDGPEGAKGRARTMVEAEKRLFKAIDLAWREPWERCTG